jgi:hypothetical protein
MKVLLNGGNYGGVEVDLPEGKTKVAVQSGPDEAWMYDSAIHVQTSTADFVGMVTLTQASEDAEAVVVDMQGV